MCAVSFIGGDWTKRWPNNPANPFAPQSLPATYPEISRAEFNALKNEVEELKKLLLAGKAYDEATGQADCEQEDKIALIKKIAEVVGVDLSEVFK